MKEKIRGLIRNNWFTLLVLAAALIAWWKPDFKVWMMQQVMRTGMVNAAIKPADKPAETERVPAFNYQDAAGNVSSTANLKGRVVFINLWASWCPPCRAEFPSVQALYNKYKNDARVFFLIINADDEAAGGLAFLKSNGYTLPLYRQAGNLPSQVYGGTLPATAVIDKEGVIRYYKSGLGRYDTEAFMADLEGLMNK